MQLDDDSPRVMSDTDSPSPGVPPGGMTRLLRDLRGLVHDHIELATLEARLSVTTLIRMGIIAIVTALALASAWLSLLGSAVLGLVRIGVAPAVAMLSITAASLLLAFVGWLRIRHLSHRLGWPATQRALNPGPVAETGRGAE